jgi:hypothetical protein
MSDLRLYLSTGHLNKARGKEKGKGSYERCSQALLLLLILFNKESFLEIHNLFAKWKGWEMPWNSRSRGMFF